MSSLRLSVLFSIIATTTPARAAEDRPEVKTESQLRQVIASWLGTPYVWGRKDKRKGTDCSGFAKGAMEESFLVELPRSSRQLLETGYAVSLSKVRAGDLVFFDMKHRGRIDHVGIYVGHGKFAHASLSRGVVYDHLKSFKNRYRGARRFFAIAHRQLRPTDPLGMRVERFERPEAHALRSTSLVELGRRCEEPRERPLEPSSERLGTSS
jgi:murein DD-endopeptidase / murein LD-carboxypeptidase